MGPVFVLLGPVFVSVGPSLLLKEMILSYFSLIVFNLTACYVPSKDAADTGGRREDGKTRLLAVAHRIPQTREELPLARGEESRPDDGN